MKHISTDQARSDLAKLVSGVEQNFETVVLTEGERDVAAIVPLAALKLLTAVFDELEDYPEHPGVPGRERIRYADLRERLGLSDRTPDADRGAALLGSDA